MRNGCVVLSLFLGYLLAAVVPSISTGESFVSFQSIQDAPWVTFLWTTTFNLGIFVPAILPMITVFITTSIECIGDTRYIGWILCRTPMLDCLGFRGTYFKSPSSLIYTRFILCNGPVPHWSSATCLIRAPTPVTAPKGH